MKKEDLFNYLKGLSPEERKKFYEEAEKAAQESTAQRLTPEKEKMSQGRRLFNLGFGELFKMSEDEFLSKIPLPQKGKTGHVLVISAKYVSPEISMTLIKVDGKCGKNYLDLHLLKDLDEAKVPAKKFYWRYGLLERAYVKLSPATCLRIINDAGYIPGTANEAIYVVAQMPQLLKEIWLDCPGSGYSHDFVPYLLLSDAGPKLDACSAGIAYPDFGSFSFGSDS